MRYSIVYTKKALEDIPKLKSARLDKTAQEIINILRVNPYQSPPKWEKLKGDLSGACSRRINHKHRLVYEVIDDAHTVKIISMWSHYDI